MPETIVIVEDDESIREMLRYYFHSVGYEVGCFPSGEAYFENEGNLDPSLFILDIMLPGMDGLEILRRLRVSSRNDRQRQGIPCHDSRISYSLSGRTGIGGPHENNR